jgi:hypothetical protein
MAFFLNETGASGDWKRLLGHFKALPYYYFDFLDTHDKRIAYLRCYWSDVLKVLRERWDEVIKVAEALKCHNELSGDQIESILT